MVLPVRDGGAWLREAVDSVLAQTWSDFELVVVDDGSRDGAAAALHGLDPRIAVLRTEGVGVAVAANLGLRAARGAYIARMDGDDRCHPERLARQVQFFEDHPDIGLAATGIEFFPRRDVREGNLRYQCWLNGLRDPAGIERELFIENPLPNPSTMMRREVLERLGGYRENVDWPEDYDFVLRVAGAGFRMGKPDGVLLRWRDHGHRLTRTDAVYGKDRFIRAKAHALAGWRLPDSPFVIWGSGPTGAMLFDALRAEGREAEGFLDLHPRRIGARKRGRPVWPLERLVRLRESFILVAVAAWGAREEIRGFMRRHGREEGVDHLFCA
ncbi:MAG: glycosyltransferase family A protein [Xanthomonadales bacterium]|nr:glycosyltransferase family A protein [Xanthomonadales bacterium]